MRLFLYSDALQDNDFDYTLQAENTQNQEDIKKERSFLAYYDGCSKWQDADENHAENVTVYDGF